MARRKPKPPSSIDRLPKDLRDLIEDLRKAGHTIDQIKAHLDEMILEPEARVSRSALGRHIIPIDDMLEDVRKSRHEVAEVASVLKETNGIEISEVNRQLLEAEYFRQLKALRELEAGPDADTLKAIASGMASNTRSRIGERGLRLSIEQETNQKAAAKVEEVAKAIPGGLTRETIDAIKAKILGVEA